MENRNCEILFEYLRSILYDPVIQQPEMEGLEEPYQKLGRGLQVLQRAVEELKEYSKDLATGNLTGNTPSRDNFLCNNLKSVQANLNHLTWQAKQVAAGDYSQNVSYLGDFSEAFNLMTAQLKDREDFLKLKAEDERKRIELIEGYNELLMTLTQRRDEWILVVDVVNREIVYCNKRDRGQRPGVESCVDCICNLPLREDLLRWNDGPQDRIWQSKEDGRFYRVTTYHIEWQGRNAWAHIIVDVTKDREAEQKLQSKAYHDAGTGLYNRFYFHEQMRILLGQKQDFTLCYMDLDGLKYVNDHYGHNEGDEYIRLFVSAIKHKFRSTDIFARVGGDEFCLILPECSREFADNKMKSALKGFMEGSGKEYPCSFSYGLVEINGEENSLSIDEIVRQADAEMYICKKTNRRGRSN